MRIVTEEKKGTSGIDTVELFLAHALTLENEAADGYQEIGDSMVVHNNPEVAALFSRWRSMVGCTPTR
jgi:hypothetical protein